MLTHEFILVDTIPDDIDFRDYNRDEMVVISDDFILENHVPIRKAELLNEYMEKTTLNYHGITIIDFEGAAKLKKVLIESCDKSEDLTKLLNILDKISIGKYIIHFGI